MNHPKIPASTDVQAPRRSRRRFGTTLQVSGLNIDPLTLQAPTAYTEPVDDEMGRVGSLASVNHFRDLTKFGASASSNLDSDREGNQYWQRL